MSDCLCDVRTDLSRIVGAASHQQASYAQTLQYYFKNTDETQSPMDLKMYPKNDALSSDHTELVTN